MEPTLLENLPSWDELFRVWPLTLWVAVFGGACYWLGRWSHREYIDYLRDQLTRKREDGS